VLVYGWLAFLGGAGWFLCDVLSASSRVLTRNMRRSVVRGPDGLGDVIRGGH